MVNFILILIIFCLCSGLVFLVFYFFKKLKNQKKNFETNIKLLINTINSVRYGNLATRLIIDEGTKFPALAESVNRMVETIQDREKMISEFKKEIVSHNFFLETLINSLSEGFLILDENFIIKKMTSESEKLFGKDAQEKSIYDFLIFEDEKIDINILSGQKCRSKFDPNVTLLATVSGLNFAENNLFKYLLTIRDISKEDELNQVKNDFIATLAHDLRVPLLAEANTLKLLKNKTFGELSPKLLSVVDLLESSNKDILALTEVLLETYKLEQTGLILNKKTVNFSNLLNDIVNEMFGVAQVNSMKINLDCDNNIEAFVDDFQIKRVLRNIIKNSIDYSSQNSDKIDIFVQQKNDGISVIIRDFGVGISSEEQKLIFQKFYSGAHKFRKVGSGLGLYLAYEIVRAHGGTISIESEPNIKTDFIIFLPGA